MAHEAPVRASHYSTPAANGFSFPPEWQKKAHAEYARYAGPGKGRQEFPPRVRFVTYTLRYPRCDWVEIIGLDRTLNRGSASFD